MASDFPNNVSHSTGDLDRRAASRDLWPGGTLDFWQGREAPEPDVVFWPEDEGEVQQVLEAAQAENIPVVPYGAGSGVCGGARGKAGSWVVDTKRLNKMWDVDVNRWTVEVQAGVNGQHLEDHLNAQGFTLGHSPSSIWCSTVGGWAAARSAGQFSSRYGVFEDMVLSLRFVSPGMGIVQLGEDGDGPDEWLGLLLGSEGTLGVITQLRLRVWPLPKKRWLRGYRFDTVEQALSAMRDLMQQELWPAVVRLYDPVDTHIGGKTKEGGHSSSHTQFLRRWLRGLEKLDPVRRRSLVLPLSLPRLVNSIFGALSSGCLMIVGWEGEEDVVDVLSTTGHRLLCERGEDLGPDPGQRWFDSRHLVSYKLAPIFERGGFADTMEVAVRWSQLETLYNNVRKAISKTAVVMAHMSHVYPEGGSIYFSFAGRGDKAVYDQTWGAALDAAQRSGATITHHHGVGSLKAKAATREVGAAISGWIQFKDQTDPNSILNPGRLFLPEPGTHDTPFPGVDPKDGLISQLISDDIPGGSMDSLEEDRELMWPWERLPAPPIWHRLPWQAGCIGVSATVAGHRCVLGRGPRSAAGPDLRPWLMKNGEGEVMVSRGVVPKSTRWMGSGAPANPWKVAQDLLKTDLRPAVLTVKDGNVLVGFRGPAARALGQIAAQRVPGGLEETEWETVLLPVGPFEPCELSAPDICSVLPSGGLRKKADSHE